MQVKRLDYIRNCNNIRVSFTNGELVDINLKEYVQKGNKVVLVSKTSGRRIPFSTTLQVIVDLNISMFTGILEFNRDKYKQIIAKSKQLIREHKKEFYEARECVEWAFSEIDKDIYRLLQVVMSDEEYMKLLELATVKRG